MKDDKREIKFRGKRIDNGEWIYGYYSLFKDNHAIMCDDGLWRKIIPESVGEFTGLLDKQGKEVYEGDIILKSHTDKPYSSKAKTLKVKCVVEYDINGFGEFTITRIDDELNREYRCRVGGYDDAEVIGNIYEHPELLTPPTSKQGEGK